MLTVDMEALKGILFVRLKGEFNKNTIDVFNNEVTSLVKDSLIRNVVFNLKDVSNIDKNGILEIMNNYFWCLNNNGLSLLCFVPDKIKYKLDKTDILKHMYLAKDELDAVRIFNI